MTKNQGVDKATIIPSFHDRQLERAKIKSKLIELKREINSRLHRSTNDRQTTRRVIAYWRKLITVDARPAPRAYEQRPIRRKIESKGKELRSTYGVAFDPRNFDETQPYYYYGPVRAWPRYWCDVQQYVGKGKAPPPVEAPPPVVTK